MASKKKTVRKGEIAPADLLEKFYSRIRDGELETGVKTFLEQIEGQSAEQLESMAMHERATMLQMMRRSALAAWKLGGILKYLKPQYAGDWVTFHRKTLGMHNQTVNRNIKMFEKIKNPAGLEEMFISEACRAFKIEGKKKKTQPPLPKPSPLPSDGQAREKIGEGLAILLQLKTADLKTLKQAKDLAMDVLKRIAELEATATNEAEASSTEVAST